MPWKECNAMDERLRFVHNNAALIHAKLTHGD